MKGSKKQKGKPSYRSMVQARKAKKLPKKNPKACSTCPDGETRNTGSTLWVKCPHQKGMRPIDSICNLDKCPCYDSCVTPNWYGNTTHRTYVQEVCLTAEHKNCLSYASLTYATKEQQDNAKEHIKEHHLFADRYRKEPKTDA